MQGWPEFAGKVVLVTGGAVGFGRAVADIVAGNGGTAWVCGRARDALDRVDEEAGAAGLDIRTAQADVTDEGAVKALFERVMAATGRLDGLVCAAGSSVMGTIEEIDPAAWDKGVSKMLRGIYLPVHAAVPIMKAAGGGSVVLTSSVHAHANVPRRDAVAAATAAMLGLVRGIAVSMGAYGVRANSVSPGPVDTPTWRKNWTTAFPELEFDEISRRVGRSIPMQRIGDSRDVAEPIAFLLSDRSRYINGADLKIDGGLTAKLAMASQLLD